jgi:hypothetical protein
LLQKAGSNGPAFFMPKSFKFTFSALHISAMKMQISEVENICDILEQGDSLKGFTLSFIIDTDYLSNS